MSVERCSANKRGIIIRQFENGKSLKWPSGNKKKKIRTQNVFEVIDKLRHFFLVSTIVKILSTSSEGIFIGACHGYCCLNDTITSKLFRIHHSNLANLAISYHGQMPRNFVYPMKYSFYATSKSMVFFIFIFCCCF